MENQVATPIKSDVYAFRSKVTPDRQKIYARFVNKKAVPVIVMAPVAPKQAKLARPTIVSSGNVITFPATQGRPVEPTKPPAPQSFPWESQSHTGAAR